MFHPTRTVLAAVAALLVLTGSATAAQAYERVARTTSTSAGCGADGLDVEAYYENTRRGTRITGVFVDSSNDMAAFPLHLTVTNSAGTVLYQDSTAGVGDGLDYLWTNGWEEAHDGSWVRIGSDPSAGWSSVTGAGLTVRVVQTEARYCNAVLPVG